MEHTQTLTASRSTRRRILQEASRELKVLVKDEERNLGYILDVPGKRVLHPDFEEDAMKAYTAGRTFDASKIPEGWTSVFYIQHARSLYRPDTCFGGTPTWHALKAIFWASASLNAPMEGYEHRHAYPATFGAKVQRHLTHALYTLTEHDQVRLLRIWHEIDPATADHWAQIYRGAQAVARIAVALHGLGLPSILPASFIDRRYSIDLIFCAGDTWKKDICLQVKSHLMGQGSDAERDWHRGGEVIVQAGRSTTIGWNALMVEQAHMASKSQKFNKKYGMNCAPAFAVIPMPHTPPYAPDPDMLTEHIQRFLKTLEQH